MLKQSAASGVVGREGNTFYILGYRHTSSLRFSCPLDIATRLKAGLSVRYSYCSCVLGKRNITDDSQYKHTRYKHILVTSIPLLEIGIFFGLVTIHTVCTPYSIY